MKRDTRRIWTDQDKARLAEMFDAGMKAAEIAPLIGRSRDAVDNALLNLKYQRDQVKKVGRVSDFIAAQQNRRLNAPPRDLTGAILGDPPVGYSALDRRDA